MEFPFVAQDKECQTLANTLNPGSLANIGSAILDESAIYRCRLYVSPDCTGPISAGGDLLILGPGH